MPDNTGYAIIDVDFTGAPGVDTSYTMERAVEPPGPYTVWTVLDSNIPLLAEQAVFTDTTAPFDTPLYYRATGEQTGQVLSFTHDAIPQNGRVWLKDPLRPWADISFDFCDVASSGHLECGDPDPEFVWGGFGAEAWNSDAGLFPVLNAERPADVWARRKFASGSIRFFTRTLDAVDRIYDLFTAGGPLLLQLPAEYGWHDHFIQPGQVAKTYISRDQRRPERRFDVPFVIVDRPLGPAQGTSCANWCLVEETFPTYADFTAETGTFLDLLEGEILCPGGVSPEALQDTFTRVVAPGGWGSATTGQPWTVQSGSAADFSVNGTVGLHTHPALGVFHTTTVPWTSADFTARGDFAVNVLPVGAGSGADIHLMGRFANITNFYSARVFIAPGTGALMLTIRKMVAGVDTQIATFAVGLNYVANDIYRIRFSGQGTSLMAKVWLASTAEPAGWQATVVDTDLTAAGAVGFRTLARVGMTNPLPIIFSMDNLVVTP